MPASDFATPVGDTVVRAACIVDRARLPFAPVKCGLLTATGLRANSQRDLPALEFNVFIQLLPMRDNRDRIRHRTRTGNPLRN